MTLAPIALFAYARPDHLRRTIDALRRNRLASESRLFVFSDGPRIPAHAEGVEEVRSIVRGICGFRSCEVIEQKQNLGLARSIIGGVGRLTSEFNKVIVVEDDIVTRPGFLEYMNLALERYQDESRVMHVSGYMYPIDPSGISDAFFIRLTSCWGWGTWRRAWEFFEPDESALIRQFGLLDRWRFDVDGAGAFWHMLMAQQARRIDSWFIRWYASVYLAGGLCLHPARSLTTNIGLDGSGRHSGVSGAYGLSTEEIVEPPVALPEELSEHRVAVLRTNRFLRATEGGVARRTRRLTLRWLQAVSRWRRQ